MISKKKESPLRAVHDFEFNPFSHLFLTFAMMRSPRALLFVSYFIIGFAVGLRYPIQAKIEVRITNPFCPFQLFVSHNHPLRRYDSTTRSEYTMVTFYRNQKKCQMEFLFQNHPT